MLCTNCFFVNVKFDAHYGGEAKRGLRCPNPFRCCTALQTHLTSIAQIMSSCMHINIYTSRIRLRVAQSIIYVIPIACYRKMPCGIVMCVCVCDWQQALGFIWNYHGKRNTISKDDSHTCMYIYLYPVCTHTTKHTHPN